MMRHSFVLLVLSIFCVSFLVSCKDEKSGEKKVIVDKNKIAKENPDLILHLAKSHPVFIAGQKGQILTLRFDNKGLMPVTIPDWRAKDGDNLSLYYAVCEKGKSKSIPFNAWRLAWPMPGGSAQGRYSPVTLNPNTGLLLDIPMDFLEVYPLPDGKPVTMAVYAELRIPSLKSKTAVREITVRPNSNKNKQRKLTE